MAPLARKGSEGLGWDWQRVGLGLAEQELFGFSKPPTSTELIVSHENLGALSAGLGGPETEAVVVVAVAPRGLEIPLSHSPVSKTNTKACEGRRNLRPMVIATASL